jgi:ribose 5-phosphate isomerase RpiB
VIASVGVSVAASKTPGVRAAMAHDTFSAQQGVEDDDLNVLALGARPTRGIRSLTFVVPTLGPGSPEETRWPTR